LIVDDPPLHRRYGFLNFQEALDLMDRNNFTTTIAFIPWNWRRTDARTVEMFRRRPQRLSVVFHGCDHMAGEFADRSSALLNAKIQTANQRISGFQRTTSINVDRVMVFPQGRFSPEVGRALKLNGFMAAVNTEVAPDDRSANQTTIGDLWSVAIMRYGSFPIFTRRYPSHGIENFAFDAVLGKPCLIASHHDIFRAHGRELVTFINGLNSLKWNLVWRPLGETLRRSFALRVAEDGRRSVEMFANHLLVDNPSSSAYSIELTKKESDPDWVTSVTVNGASISFRVLSNCLCASFSLLSGTTADIRLTHRSDSQNICEQQPAYINKVRVAAKRYLSEFRDNYVSRNQFLLQTVGRLRQSAK
jgi:hypothetical protein